MPTAASHRYEGTSLIPYMNQDDAVRINVRLAASKDYVAGEVLAEVTATPGTYDKYDGGGAGGLEVARALLEYDCQTDSNGLITLSSVASTDGGEHGEKLLTAPAFVKGMFQTADLTGLDADAVAELGRLVQGSTTNGILLM